MQEPYFSTISALSVTPCPAGFRGLLLQNVHHFRDWIRPSLREIPFAAYPRGLGTLLDQRREQGIYHLLVAPEIDRIPSELR